MSRYECFNLNVCHTKRDYRNSWQLPTVNWATTMLWNIRCLRIDQLNYCIEYIYCLKWRTHTYWLNLHCYLHTCFEMVCEKISYDQIHSILAASKHGVYVTVPMQDGSDKCLAFSVCVCVCVCVSFILLPFSTSIVCRLTSFYSGYTIAWMEDREWVSDRGSVRNHLTWLDSRIAAAAAVYGWSDMTQILMVVST